MEMPETEPYQVQVGKAIEAVLRWLSENPIVPTDEQMAQIVAAWRQGHPENFYIHCSIEWQRRMFLVEPEMPKEIEDLIAKHFGVNPSDWVKQLAIESFRCGQRSKEHP